MVEKNSNIFIDNSEVNNYNTRSKRKGTQYPPSKHRLDQKKVRIIVSRYTIKLYKK